MRSIRALGAALAGGALGAVLLGVPAWATAGAVPLDAAALQKTAAMHERVDPVVRERDCADLREVLASLGTGSAAGSADGWAFTLPESFGDGFKDLQLTFATPAGGDVAVNVPGQSAGPAWRGEIGPRGGRTDHHAYVVTGGGWTLLRGTADVSGPTDASSATFAVSHTCADVFGATTPTAEPHQATTGSRHEDNSLVVGSVLLVGAGLIAAGVALVGVRSRRDPGEG